MPLRSWSEGVWTKVIETFARMWWQWWNRSISSVKSSCIEKHLDEVTALRVQVSNHQLSGEKMLWRQGWRRVSWEVETWVKQKKKYNCSKMLVCLEKTSQRWFWWGVEAFDETSHFTTCDNYQVGYDRGVMSYQARHVITKGEDSFHQVVFAKNNCVLYHQYHLTSDASSKRG